VKKILLKITVYVMKGKESMGRRRSNLSNGASNPGEIEMQQPIIRQIV
jgi:hypothetical protein